MTAAPEIEHAALVALLRSLPKGVHWRQVAEDLLDCGSAAELWERQVSAALLPRPEDARAHADAVDDLRRWEAEGFRFLSVLDPEYPARLRDVHQVPPFLFAAGSLMVDDVAIAVVGSRKASERGLRIATAVAAELARRGVTVLSGLAEGIDGAAHRAALEGSGRTVAIIGTGLAKWYPAVHRDLQATIVREGMVLSQFWPDAPPQPHNFIMRNAVMSGYGRATVVVEAGEKSGARAQARMAVEHGRPVILIDQVVNTTEWGRRLKGRPGVHVASSLSEVMSQIDELLAQERVSDQLLTELSGRTL